MGLKETFLKNFTRRTSFRSFLLFVTFSHLPTKHELFYFWAYFFKYFLIFLWIGKISGEGIGGTDLKNLIVVKSAAFPLRSEMYNVTECAYERTHGGLCSTRFVLVKPVAMMMMMLGRDHFVWCAKACSLLRSSRRFMLTFEQQSMSSCCSSSRRYPEISRHGWWHDFRHWFDFALWAVLLDKMGNLALELSGFAHR